MRVLMGLMLVFSANGVLAGVEEPKVRYKAGKEVNFEELLIQGQLKRPEISVITGSQDQGTNGLLRLRENFLDRMAMDAGEESSR